MRRKLILGAVIACFVATPMWVMATGLTETTDVENWSKAKLLKEAQKLVTFMQDAADSVDKLKAEAGTDTACENSAKDAQDSVAGLRGLSTKNHDALRTAANGGDLAAARQEYIKLSIAAKAVKQYKDQATASCKKGKGVDPGTQVDVEFSDWMKSLLTGDNAADPQVWADSPLPDTTVFVSCPTS